VPFALSDPIFAGEIGGKKQKAPGNGSEADQPADSSADSVYSATSGFTGP
jgi:hypothetical protein